MLNSRPLNFLVQEQLRSRRL